MPVNSGNVISVPKADLTSKRISVKWSQNLRDRSQDYFVSTFTDKNTGESNLIFIQDNMLDQLKSRATSEEYTFVVNGDYQYGEQNKAGERRFLVYHNKDNKMYQHRFVESTLVQLGSKGVELLSRIGGQTITDGADFARKFIGNNLCNF